MGELRIGWSDYYHDKSNVFNTDEVVTLSFTLALSKGRCSV